MIETRDPNFRLMRDEIFGPVVTTYVYDEKRWTETLDLVDRTAPYGLTGAVFSEDRAALDEAQSALRYAAGNFYVNDKPTGAVVGQQPFGGARASGTNDKAGSMWNLIRWVSPRTIKETFVAAERLPLPVPRVAPRDEDRAAERRQREDEPGTAHADGGRQAAVGEARERPEPEKRHRPERHDPAAVALGDAELQRVVAEVFDAR